MKIINGVQSLQSNPLTFQRSVITIGNFDGVHLGHQELICRVVERARVVSGPAIVMTFDPHPVKVLHPERKVLKIFDVEDQNQQLARRGIDYLVVEPFSREFSQLPPDRFVQDWIVRPFRPETVVVGYDFSFGAHRQGSIAFLQSKGREWGFAVDVVPPLGVEGLVVSSSRIRTALAEGKVDLAHKLLGRPFYLKGLVEKGAGRGRKIGIPTANLRSTGDGEVLPARGVYAGWASLRGEKVKALVNIGLNPTFIESSLQSLSIEAHFPSYKGSDLYGELICIEFIARLRDEQKFSSVDDLVKQIHHDIAAGEKILDDEVG